MDLTARQAAEELTSMWEVDGQAPRVHQDKVKAWVRGNLLPDVSTTSRVMIPRDKVEALGKSIRYIPDVGAMLDALGCPIYRVSVREQSPSWVTDSLGHTLRTNKGVDYDLDPNVQLALGGWEGVWPISENRVDWLIEHDGLLGASFGGLIHEGYLRPVTSYTDVGGRRYLHTAPAPRNVQDFLGAGIMIDIPGGPISDFITPESGA